MTQSDQLLQQTSLHSHPQTITVVAYNTGRSTVQGRLLENTKVISIK